ncbi:bifunctional diguanylate cyclase/phosphodiesterase [Salidesulfovibrio onnuriiensis]|uniref:bifunctional diguanylate cyclase/phosphodiesterase n=1 Tax=Salidesulfovibrio onnuriiensis TaxID=2583823 RepID=UPI0011CA51DA|nr:EAL domain-containing protein [Salidesulfovibrio onnuriiensis]
MYTFLQNIRISSRLMVGYSLLFIVAFVTAGFIVHSLVRDVLKQSIENELQVSTDTVVNMVETAASVSIKNRLRAIAEKNLEIVTNIYQQYEKGDLDKQAAMRKASDILLGQTIGETGYIYCLDGKGIVRVHPMRELVGEDIKDLDFIREQLERRNGFLEYQWKSPGDERPRPKALYMVSFDPWDWIISVSAYRSEFTTLVDAEDFRESIARLRMGESGYSFIVDGSGRTVIHPFAGENLFDLARAQGRDTVRDLLSRKSGSILYQWKNPGEEQARDKILVFRYLPEFDWIVCSTSYVEEMYAPLRKLSWIILSTGLATLLLVLSISLVLGKSVTKPLYRLMRDFERAADGDLSLRSGIESRDEVGLLARQFNMFMGRLELSRDALEKETEVREEVEYRHKLFEKVFESALEGILITDRDARIVAVNPAFSAITGYEPYEVMGHTPRILKSDRHEPEFFRRMWDDLADSGRWTGEIWNRRKNGESYPEIMSISAIRDVNGEVTHYVSVFHDITDMKLQEERIQFQAYHDALTGLPNRDLLCDRLTVAIAHAARKDVRVGLLCIDLDNFKNVNDSLGHAKGDHLLQEVGNLLSLELGADATVARLGGDEFVIMVEGEVDARGMADYGNLILSLFQKPFRLEGEEFYITPSIGMTLYPDDGDDPGTLIKNADMAMFQAKESGKNSYHLFTPAMNDKVSRRLKMESDMRKGLRRDEFMVYYQPKIDLCNHCVSGMEALVRWIRLDGSLMNPGEFIPLAEETGLIVEIGERVLDKACAFLRLLDETEYRGLSVAVNLSPLQFREKDLVSMVARTLKIHELPPERLELEITESTLMKDVDETIRKLNELVDMGIRISIDDFGTGYSSLYYLKNFPIDTLKIDRSFVRDINEDPNDAQIVQTITLMAENLGIGVVAEGVETREQEALLLSFGCAQAQGFLYSKPLPGTEFESFLRRLGEQPCKPKSPAGS